MKKLNVDLFFQLGLLSLFLLLIWESRSYPFESRFYPQILGWITVAFLLFSLIRHFVEKGKEEVADPGVATRRRRIFQISLVVILATVLGLVGGFIISVLCYYVTYALFQKNIKKERYGLLRTLGIGIALTVLFYISFGWFLNVPLFRGWLVNF